MLELGVETQEVIEVPEQVEVGTEVVEHLERQVLERLGEPENLHKIAVKPLWDRFYRINVICEEEAAGIRMALSEYRITDSFFVRVSPEGGIIRSEPEITKRYE